MFLDFVFEPSGVDVWSERMAGDAAAVESVVDHVHLCNFFAPQSEIENEALIDIGRVMASSWKCAAESQFPDREVIVEFNDGTDDYGPTVSIHASRSAL